jgi:hypothetical protein
MKTKIISKVLLSLGLVFVLGSAITQVRGDSPVAIEPPGPVVSIHSTGDVTRGKTGSFVLNMQPIPMFGAPTYVNFSVSGTAIPGVDYVALVSPTLIGASGYGVILVKTLPDRRALSSGQKYSVVVTLQPGPGYTVSASAAASSSAIMWIEPCTSAAGCQ